LDTYEYEEGIPIHNIECLRCPKCGELMFTERQADKMEEITEKLKQQMFVFVRKVGYSGKSLIVSIPEDLASHLKVEKGQKVSIRPIDKKGFFVEIKK
jgi:hypothetical protein